MQTYTTTLGYYLIIAEYDRKKWNSLSNGKTLGPDRTANHREAEDHAKTLFPYQRKQSTTAMNEPAVLGGQEQESYEQELPLPYPPGVLLVHTFHTGIHAKIAERNVQEMGTDEEKQAVVDEIYSAFNKRIPPSETEEEDPGIGWVAVVHRDSLKQFLNMMGGRDGALWGIYKMRVIPLNEDNTTADIYTFMTPTNWGH
jgi:hypothetical protein